ncbi:MAG: phosphatase PAP2 family protein [Verrucomicrobiota bacterium]|nr:phosphatase PAP2 family protein [Verrucomicrobiota bacterium]
MNKRQLISWTVVTLMLTLLSIFLLDQPIAAFVQRAGGRSSVIFLKGTSFLEIAFGFPINRSALTYALLAAAALLFIWKSTRSAAWMVLFIACVQISTRLAVVGLKTERLRPFEVIQAGNWDWKFFRSHGNAFPSGHGAYFWGLYFPLVFLFPRYRLPLLIIPLFISVARVGVNDHWCSDVLASATVAALITLIFIGLFRMKECETRGPVRQDQLHG